MERRLAAVLAADMVGYSRLMGADEQGTLSAYRRHVREHFTPRAAQYHGRLIKLTGDGALLEFGSVVDCVHFAVELQLALRGEESAAPQERVIRYRMGINLGDIMLDEGDIFGDGVNVAARLQEIADPGGICVSGPAVEQVRGKLALDFEHLGPRALKNIDNAVDVYRIVLDERAEALVTPAAVFAAAPGASARSPGRIVVAGFAAFALLAPGLYWWRPWERAPPALERPAEAPVDQPSIAVLPIVNVSGDGGQDHVAEGLTGDLITELSKVSGLFVIARHSVFAFRGMSAKVPEIATELGVRYVLEGTLRLGGSRLRVNVNLVDAPSGVSMWAESYDREYQDLFAVQDDVVGKIAAALSVKLTENERVHLARVPTENLEAYDYYMRAEQEGSHFSDVETYRRSLSFYQRAIALDPRFADAYAGIASIAVDVWRNDYNFLWTAAVARKIAYDAAGQALRFDPANARAHSVLALLQAVDGRTAEAEESARRAVALKPGDPHARGNLALVLVYSGAVDEAVSEIGRALRLDPTPPPGLRLLAGVVYYLARDYRRALPLIEGAEKQLPQSEPALEYLAAAHARLGDVASAAAQVDRLERLFPTVNLNYYDSLYDYWLASEREHHVAALRQAGVPLWPFGFQGRPEDRLDEAELKRLTVDTSWRGRHKNGTDFVQFFDAAGNTAYRSANTSITGKVALRDGRLCENFEGNFLDRWTCGDVYRNVDPAAPDAGYVHVSPLSLKYFSLAPP